jgi:hypothetical protein
MEQVQDRTDDLRILRTVSLTSALEREIERLILTGELPPGDRRRPHQRDPARQALRHKPRADP